MAYEEFKDLEENIINRLFGFRFLDSGASNISRINCLMGAKVQWDQHDGIVFIHAKKRHEIFYKDGKFKAKDDLFKLKVQGVQAGHSIPSHVSYLKPVGDHEDQFKLYDLAKTKEGSPKERFTGEFERLDHDLVVWFEGDLMPFDLETKIQKSEMDILDQITKSRNEGAKTFISKKSLKLKDQKKDMVSDEDQLSFDDFLLSDPNDAKEVDPVFVSASSQIKQSQKQASIIKRHFEKCLFYLKVVIPSNPSLLPFFEIMPNFKGFVFPYLHLMAFTKSTEKDFQYCQDAYLKAISEYEKLSPSEKVDPNEDQLKVIRAYQFCGYAYQRLQVATVSQTLPIRDWIEKFDQMLSWVDEIKQKHNIYPNLRMGF
jgi:hypothetical protein